jgi:hypothetical protein
MLNTMELRLANNREAGRRRLYMNNTAIFGYPGDKYQAIYLLVSLGHSPNIIRLEMKAFTDKSRQE